MGIPPGRIYSRSTVAISTPTVIQLWEDCPKIMNGIRGRLIQTGAGISIACEIWPNRCQLRWRAVILSILTNTALIMTDRWRLGDLATRRLCGPRTEARRHPPEPADGPPSESEAMAAAG